MIRKFVFIGLLVFSHLAFSEPFDMSSYQSEEPICPEKLICNMTSDIGKKYIENPTEAFLFDLKQQAEQGSAKAYFDLGVIYFLGIGLKKDNQTAVENFLDAYSLPGGLSVAASNAAWIVNGPPRSKDLSDLTDSLGRKLDRKLLWTRDWLLYLESALFGSGNKSVTSPAEEKAKSLTEKPAPVASKEPT